MEPNPDQPDRCQSIDPYSTLQCARKDHPDDDNCQFGGIAWEKGTPRHVELELVRHLHLQRTWSEQTFGPGAREAGVIDHIQEELQEVEDAETPEDKLAEWIDVVILGLDGAWRSGASPEEIAQALMDKQSRNEKREWPDWRTQDTGKKIKALKPNPLMEGPLN